MAEDPFTDGRASVRPGRFRPCCFPPGCVTISCRRRLACRRLAASGRVLLQEAAPRELRRGAPAGYLPRARPLATRPSSIREALQGLIHIDGACRRARANSCCGWSSHTQASRRSSAAPSRRPRRPLRPPRPPRHSLLVRRTRTATPPPLPLLHLPLLHLLLPRLLQPLLPPLPPLLPPLPLHPLVMPPRLPPPRLAAWPREALLITH